jgi:ABC-type transport system substrate-binding protein
LAEAGFGPGDLTLRFPTRADFQETSQAIAAYLDAIGIKTELELQEHAIYRQTLRSKGEAYDLYTTYPSRATTTELLAFYGGGHGSHVYSDTEEGVPPPRVAELYAAQASEMDLQRREALIREMIAIVEKDIPCVVFGYPKSPATVHHPWLSGPFVNRSQPFYLGLEWIEIDQQVYAEWAKTH